MQFKLWLQKENLSGPGGGPDWSPIDLKRLHQDIAAKGAGAFNRLGDEPPVTKKSPTAAYLDPKYHKMKKKMKKNQ